MLAGRVHRRGSSRTVSETDRGLTPLTVAFAAALTSLCVGAYQLSRPGVLRGVLGYNIGYDDGIYMGAATHLARGVLPYRDFVIVHPPGITYLMLPAAIVGRIFNAPASVVAGRLLTVAVVAANAMLAGLLVRRRGRMATGVVGFAVALWPLTVSVDRAVELEPYLVFFCLIGALLVFDGAGWAAERRVILGGAAFGFACAVKLWAALPVIAVLLCSAPVRRQVSRPLVKGLLLGGTIPCLPFLILAPTDFVHDVVTAQLGRNPSVYAVPLSLGDRLLLISGLGGWGGLTQSQVYPFLLFGALGVLVMVAYGFAWAQRSPFEWYVLVSAVVVNVGMFVSPELYDHYAYFPAVFLAILLGVSGYGTYSFLATAYRGKVSIGTRTAMRAAAGAAAIAVVLAGFAHGMVYARLYLSEVSNPRPALTTAIPSGACVLTDYPIDLLIADRFTSDRPDCPPVVDPFGLYLAYDGGNQPHPNPPYETGFVEKWRNWLDRADYVVLRIPYSSFLPWTEEQISWFNGRYTLVSHDRVQYRKQFVDSRKDLYIYRNVQRTSTSGLLSSSEILLRRGLEAHNAGRLAEAQRDYSAALKADAHNKFAAYDLGVIAQSEGRDDQARRWYERAIDIDPSYVSALYNLAVLLTATAPARAEDIYRTLIREHADDVNLHLRLSQLLQREGRATEAAGELATAARLDPTVAGAA